MLTNSLIFNFMKKTKLINFIGKYHLAGLVNSVEWNFKGGSCKVNFISEDKSLLGNTQSEFSFNDTSVGIYSTVDLLKFLSPFSEDLDVEIQNVDDRPTNLLISDTINKGRYVLSDPAVIPNAGSIKQLPEFEIEIKLSRAILTNFIKLANALPDAQNVGIQTIGDKIEFIIGYSDINTNRLSFSVGAKIQSEMKTIIFSTPYIKAIFDANKDMEMGLLKISSQGLMQVQFKGEETISEYFLVSLEME